MNPWAAVCEKVAFTPAGHRRPISPEQATKIFRCSRAELSSIVAAGLPAGGDGGIDAFDAINVALYSGSGATAPELQMKALKNVLRPGLPAWIRDCRWEIYLTASCDGCPDPAAPWHLEPGVGRRATWQVEPPAEPGAQPVVRRSFRARGRDGVLRSPLARSIVEDTLSGLRFQYAPESVDRDRELTSRRRVASCLGASLLLADRLTDHGFEVQLRSGVLIGLARVTKHNWLEVVDDDGETKCIDSALALVAEDHLLPQFREFCLGGRFNRLVEVRWEDKPTLLHACTYPPVTGIDDAYVRQLRRRPAAADDTETDP